MVHVNELFESLTISKSELDFLLAEGWRHFGIFFYRYSDTELDGRPCRVLPLRLNVNTHQYKKSHRRLLRKNADLHFEIRDAFIDDEKKKLFYNHRRRFTIHIPNSIYDFFSLVPNGVPTHLKEAAVFKDGKLIACSFFDLSSDAASTIYGMFDLEESQRYLGIYTMLLEIEYTKSIGKTYYYLGYSYDISSFYDYKKKFNGLEYYNWKGLWLPLEKFDDYEQPLKNEIDSR